MPSILDRQIAEAKDDAFGHEYFAHALRDLVESPTNSAPFSIGLLGRWGTGKSSIKEMYVHELSQDREAPGGTPQRSERFRTVTFNAWQYGGENIRRALLRSAYLALGGSEPDFMDRLFNQVQKPTQVARDARSIRNDLYEKLVWPLPFLLGLLALMIGFAYLAKLIFGLSDEWVIWAVLAIGGLGTGAWAKFFLDPKRFVVPRYANVTRVELPAAAAEQYERLLADQLADFKKKNPACERVVVFVDDLDRLSAEEMVSGLDAVRALMEISEESGRLGMVFVISCDEDKIAEALGNRKRQADLPGVIFNQADARRYLDRIFQFRLEIPPAPRLDMRAFALKRLSSGYPGLADDLAASGSSVEEVVGRMIHVGVESPRNALQIVNAFSQSWWLARQREWGGAGNERPGGLSTGSVTGYPVALAALSALKVDFPDFYGQLLEQPDLIQKFIAVYVDRADAAGLTEGARLALAKYSKLDADKEPTWELNAGCRPLRRFLSSLSGLRWPKSLQPLLIMAQDPVTRRTGDVGRTLFDALVSGDVRGVLEALGRDKDQLPITPDKLPVIADVLEEVDADTADRRDRAYATLASISDRFPSDAGPVASPTARRLAASREARSLAGVDGIEKLMPLAAPEQKQGLAGALVGDFARPEGPLLATLPSGEPFPLDVALPAVRKAIGLALSVRSSMGLSPADDGALLTWLSTRTVSVGDQKASLTFEELESWMEEYEESLPLAMSAEYLDVVASEMNSDEDAGSEGSVRRVGAVLDDLWNKGESSRREALAYATRFAALPQPIASRLSQDYFRTHLQDVSDGQASEFVKALSARVSRFGSAKGLDQVDTDATNLIIQTMSAKRLDADGLASVGTAAQSLSRFEACGDHAARLAKALVDADEDAAANVLTAWSARTFTDLPSSCRLVLAENVDLISTDAETAVVQLMNAEVQAALSDPARATKYVEFVGGLSDEKLTSDLYAPHVTQLLGTLNQNHPNLKAIEPIRAPLVRAIRLKPAVASQEIQNAAQNSSPYPESHATLHRYLTGVWPKPSASAPNYDPPNSFNWGRSVVENNPAQPYAADVLRSLGDMLTRGIVPTNLLPSIVPTAIAAWPYHPGAAAEALVKSRQYVEPGQAASLADSVATESELPALRLFWQPYASDESRRVPTARALLGVPLREFAGKPDGILNEWLSICGADWLRVCTDLLSDASLSDDQRLRVWKQIERRVDELSPEQFVNVLRVAVLGPQATASAAIESVDRVRARQLTDSQTYELGKALTLMVPKAGTLDSKRGLAAAAAKTGNKAVAKAALEQGSGFTQEDFQILYERFPGDKQLKKKLEAEPS